MANYDKAIPFKPTTIYKGSGSLRLTPASSGIADARRRTGGGTLKPPVQTTPPPAGTMINMAYDYDGTYLGWTENPEAIKWCYGISYKSGKRYNVVTERSVQDPIRPNKYVTRMMVYEKSSDEVALTIYTRTLTEADLIDPNDRISQVEYTKKAVEDLDFEDGTRYGGGISWRVDDPYNLAKPLLKNVHKSAEDRIREIEKEASALEDEMQKKVDAIRNKKRTIVDELKKQLTQELDKLAAAEQKLKGTSQETGIELDI